jgi:hypothetical protein
LKFEIERKTPTALCVFRPVQAAVSTRSVLHSGGRRRCLEWERGTALGAEQI